MRKKLFPLLAVFMVMILLTACSGSGGSQSDDQAAQQQTVEDQSKYDDEIAKGPNGETAYHASDITLTDEEYAKIKGGKYKAALLWAGSGEWYNALTEGAKAEFEKLGIEVVAVSDAQFDPAKQATDIETSLALKPDIILSLPVDPVSGARAFQPAVDKGIKLVFADNGVDGYTAGNEYIAIVTGDHYGMGRAAAELMNEALDGKGEIGYIFHDADFFVTNNRDGAFRRAIEKNYPDLKIIAEAGFSEENATGEVASSMLIQNPDIKGIYVAWDIAAEPVVAELRAAGKTDVKVVTYDLGANNDLDMAQDGNVYAKVADKPVEIGQTMARLAAYKILGKEAPTFVVCGLIKMKKDNIEEAWMESLNKEPADNIKKALGN